MTISYQANNMDPSSSVSKLQLEAISPGGMIQGVVGCTELKDNMTVIKHTTEENHTHEFEIIRYFALC